MMAKDRIIGTNLMREAIKPEEREDSMMRGKMIGSTMKKRKESVS